MFQNKATTVAEYLDSLPEDRRKVVKQMRTFVRKHLPKGYEEGLDFGAITYRVPLKKLPDTYNGQPLCYAALAAQKNYYTLYLMGPYGMPKLRKQLEDGFKKAGKRLDMGKSCLHFKSVEDLPLPVVGDVIASIPMEKYIEAYHQSRKKKR